AVEWSPVATGLYAAFRATGNDRGAEVAEPGRYLAPRARQQLLREAGAAGGGPPQNVKGGLTLYTTNPTLNVDRRVARDQRTGAVTSVAALVAEALRYLAQHGPATSSSIVDALAVSRRYARVTSTALRKAIESFRAEHSLKDGELVVTLPGRGL